MHFFRRWREEQHKRWLRSHFGALTQIMISTMVTTANPLLLAFAFERPIFLREYSSHMYSSVAYFLSKTLVEIPVTFMTVTEMWIIAYFLMDFQGNFLFLVLISVGLCMGISSVALMLGCSVATAKSAQELAPLVLVPQILFTGIFVSINLIPRCLRWIQYGCALKYALNLVVIVEFADLDERDKETLFAEYDIEEHLWWFYVLVLVGIIVVFRVIALVQLRRKATYLC